MRNYIEFSCELRFDAPRLISRSKMTIAKVNRTISHLAQRLKLRHTGKAAKDSLKTNTTTSLSTTRDESMKCEVKHLDLLWDDRDEQYYKERKDEVKKPKQKDWWRLFAFCLVRVYYEDDELDTTRLYVNAEPLRRLLRDVIGDYPDDPVDVDDVQIESPYYSLFYYRAELEREGRARFKEDEEAAAQLRLLVQWIRTHFEAEIAAFERCVGDLRAISYEHLWTLFPPGKIIHAKVLNQHRAFRVHSCWYEGGDSPILNIWADFVDFDGEKLGTRKAELFVAKYAGTRQLRELATMPLDLVEDGEEIREVLVRRGRKFEGFVGQHFKQYDGVALRKTEQGYARINVKGRVMIDCETYHRLEANDTFDVVEFGGKGGAEGGRSNAVRQVRGGKRKTVNAVGFVAEKRAFEKLSDEDALVANATVRGYAFAVKQFLEFFVDKVAPIEWNERCFDDLVLDQDTKKTVQAVVSTHSSSRDGFDDIVKGKGQGLVCVLHGPPGVGKTLTAECVAEYVKRPLYMISSGDLGVSSGHLDLNLTRIMDLASTWKAVLLIDEADVFLERRSLHDVHRNAMVSVFLRALEYYSGILFLTTNRVSTFDDGFKSRIHVPIRYTDLSFPSRLQIWRTLCGRVPGGVDVDEDGLESLARHDMNGRQIKNIIKAAESLAAFDGVKVDLSQMEQVARIQNAFEKDLTSVGGVDYTAPGESKGDGFNMFL
ncbi:P-loop containing nucleoside triphosphate hydrolase protein [Annulohypoxylon maeteangense]|uniref:P-loop containing nucleoside triphosphate hydrolase protein n=1 Tax=Annulohypoxylon maeteangense TaxID=1927788 RepID=UPI002008A291|nr:P-loop containing nucleoside triphosphate hydrolase protein [Annulohypoxylon maeteangense]KAI0887428.1 P-loop containing nucleoside triphosphate hydrolase protein [Annulohypoxylon maeteangense]